MLAHHYVEALEIAAALDADASELAPRARVALTEAGDRARLLNAPEAALRFYGKALELWPADAAGERAELLFRVALTYFDADADERGDALERAREALLATGDTARAAEADALLVQYWWMQGDNDRVVEHLSRAEALVRGLPASPGKARVLSQSTRFRTLAGELDLDAAQEARRLAEELGLDELVAQTAITIGTIRFTSGDPGGKADVQRGLDYGIAANRLPLIIRGNTVLATLAEQEGDLRETARLGEEALSAAERLGGGASIRWALGNVIVGLPEAGEWDRCLELADGFLAEAEAGTSHYNDGAVLLSRALVRFGRGQLEPAFADLSAALTKARRIKDRQVVLPTLTTYAYVLADAERDAEAAAFFDEALDAGPALFGFSDDVIWAADLLGRREDLSGIFPETAETRRLQAYRAFLAGDFARAAELFDSMGAVRSASLARVHGGVELDRALAFFRSVGARRYVERVEALLARSA
jgi:tetratricopeptide (TPR) repeat protein